MRIRLTNEGMAFMFWGMLCLPMSIITALGISESFPIGVFFVWLTGIIIFLSILSKGVFRTTNDIVVFWGSFIVKVGYSLYRFPLSMISDPLLAEDAERYWRLACYYHDGIYSRGSVLFSRILNMEFYVFGKNVLCCCLTNTALTMIMVYFVIKYLNKYGVNRNTRLYSMLVSCFMIYIVIVCNSILRESIYTAFIAASFFAYVSYIESKKTTRLLFAIGLLIPVLMLHIGYFPIAAVYLIDYYRNGKVRTRKDLISVTAVFIVTLVFTFYVSSMRSVNYLTGRGGIQGIIGKIVNANSDRHVGNAGSRYLAGIRISSVPTFILYSPIKWVYYMFSPLPTNWRGLSDVVAFAMDGMVHFFVLFTAGVSIRRLRRNGRAAEDAQLAERARILRVGFWAVVLCGFIFGLGTSTAGTAIRHRDVMIGIEAFMLGLSLMLLKSQGRARSGQDRDPALLPGG